MWGGGSSISIELITVIGGIHNIPALMIAAPLHHFWAHPKHDHTEDQHAQTHTPPSPSRIESMHLLESAGEDAGQLVDCRLCGCLVHLLAHSLRHVAVHLSSRLHTGRRSSSSRATVHNNTHTHGLRFSSLCSLCRYDWVKKCLHASNHASYQSQYYTIDRQDELNIITGGERRS